MALDAARDDFEFAVEGLRGKIRARDDKLAECVSLHDQQQKAVKRGAKEGKKGAAPVDTASVAELQADLDRGVGELRTLSKLVVDGIQSFVASYTDWFDGLLALHLKLKCSLRSVASEDLGSKLVSELEADVAKLAEDISARVKSARDAESVLLLDSAIPVDRCLSHPLILSHYRAYMKEQLAEESLNFLLRIIEYRSEEDQQLRKAAAKAIFDEYLIASSPKEVNLAGSIVDSISKALDGGNPELFRDAERSVLYTLQTDTWRRFLLSAQFQALQKRSKALQDAATPRAIRTKSQIPAEIDIAASPDAHSPASGSSGSGGGLKKLLARTLSSKQVQRQSSAKDVKATAASSEKRAANQTTMVNMSPSSAPTGDASELEIPENIAKQELILLSDNIRRSLNEAASSDVVIYVGAENKEFYAHKFILQARCPLLLRSDSAKTPADARAEISLPSATPKGFKYFLEYIYTGTLPAVTASVLQELVALAGQAHLPHLEELCAILAVTRANASELTAQVNQLYPTVPAPHSDEYPKYEAILAVLAASAHEIFSNVQAHPFFDIYKGHLINLLQRDDLVVDSELQLFEFVLLWAERHTNSQSRVQELKPLIDAIRFTQMSADELRLRVEPTALVADHALLEAYRFKSTGTCANSAKAKPRKYRNVRRPATVAVFASAAPAVPTGSSSSSPSVSPIRQRTPEKTPVPSSASPVAVDEPKTAKVESTTPPPVVVTPPSEESPAPALAAEPRAVAITTTEASPAHSGSVYVAIPAEPTPAAAQPTVAAATTAPPAASGTGAAAPTATAPKKAAGETEKAKDKKDKDKSKDKKDREKDKPAGEEEKPQKKGFRQFFKRTSDFLNGKPSDGKKEKSKVDPSKRDTIAVTTTTSPNPRDVKRLTGEAGEFRLTKVDYGNDGKEQQLTVSTDDERGGSAGMTPSSSATSIPDSNDPKSVVPAESKPKTEAAKSDAPATTTPEPAAAPRKDGEIAKADVALVDAILQEVQVEIAEPSAPASNGNSNNTTSTEEDEDDLAARQQMIEARRQNRSFTTITKPNISTTANNPRKAKDDSAASSRSSSGLDLSAVEKLLNEPMPTTMKKKKSSPSISPAVGAKGSKDNLRDIEKLLEETAPQAAPADPVTRAPSLAEIEKLLEETSSVATDVAEETPRATASSDATHDMGDVLDLLKQSDAK